MALTRGTKVNSRFEQAIERAIVTVDPPYRVGVTTVDKTQLAANSILFQSPNQDGAKYCDVYSHLELVAPSTQVDIDVIVRKMNPNKLVDPTAFIKTVNAGGAYTDYTTQVTDDDASTEAALSALDTVANGDYVLVCYDEIFVGLSLEIDSTNKNIITTALAVHYWNGAWTAVSNLKDGTKNGAATFNHDGEILWNLPDDWVESTINGVTGYWVRLSVNAILSANVKVEECGILLDYAYVGLRDRITLDEANKFIHTVSVDGEDIAVLLHSITGAGSVKYDNALGWH